MTSSWQQANNLGNILVRSGVITLKQLEKVVDEQRKRKAKAGDSGEVVLFGRIAVDLGFCSDAQVTEALEIQRANMAPAANACDIDDAFAQLDRAVDGARAGARRTTARLAAVQLPELPSHAKA